MHSAEVLSQLRTLNWLGKESQRVAPAGPERALIDTQIDSLRARLPLAILQYHDERTRLGLPKVAKVHASSCGHCEGVLPTSLLKALSAPDRFVVCPKCGIFLWTEHAEEKVAKFPLHVSELGPRGTKKGRGA